MNAALKSFCLVMLTAVSLAGWAAVDVEPLSTEELQARYKVLITELRCPKCQNQNLADSNAPIATDLRREVRRLLEEGNTDAGIKAYLVERYGDFILYRPPVKSETYILWLGPLSLLLVAGVVVVMVIRRQRRLSTGGTQLAAEEEQRLADLLEQTPSDKTDDRETDS